MSFMNLSRLQARDEGKTQFRTEPEPRLRPADPERRAWIIGSSVQDSELLPLH